MKWIYIFLAILFVGLTCLAYPLLVSGQSARGRIYRSDEQTMSSYPGYSVVGEWVEEQIFVNPKDEPVFFGNIENKDQYQSDKYEVTSFDKSDKVVNLSVASIYKSQRDLYFDLKRG